MAVPRPRTWYADDAQAVLGLLEVTADTGLSRDEAAKRLRRFGPNTLQASGGRSDLGIFLEQFLTLPVGLLGVSAVVSIATGGVLDAAVIMAVVLINSAIGYLTERQAEQTIRSLADLRPRYAKVLREGIPQFAEAVALVPGDIVLLEPGGYVAADLRLLQGRHLTLDESVLTGESLPVEKHPELALPPETPIGDRHNMAFMGTTVTGGSGKGVVVATALGTELGQIQSMLGDVRPPDTPMETQLDQLGSQLAVLSGAVCGGVFVVGLLRGLGWLEMLKASVSLAVAAVPEGLPTVATTTLALGIARMRRHQVAIRHLDAVETLGSVQTFCLDKTGTLTQNRMAVTVAMVGLTEHTVGAPFPAAEEPLPTAWYRLLGAISLCNEAELSAAGTLSGSPTEQALLAFALSQGIAVPALRRAHPVIELRPRAEGRPLMSSLHRMEDGRLLMAVKGSPSELLERCSWFLEAGQVLDEDTREAIGRHNEAMATQALRVLGIAYRTLTDDDATDTQGLVWLGLVGMTDPVRPGISLLMREFHRAGIRTVMITGDQAATAYAVGKELDLAQGRPLRVLEAGALERMEPQMLRGLVRDVDVFARVSPAHKLRIVQAYQQAGQVVAMTGDGINDGPALKAADSGVAMGQGGTDLARSVADVVLEDDNLHTMLVAVEQGRTIYANIRKTVHFLLATNFTEIEMMAAAIALGLGQPLNPMQLLWINLLSDIFPGLALSMEPPQTEVMSERPRDPREPIIPPADLGWMVSESAVITLGAMASFLAARGRYGAGSQATTVAFNTLTTGQLLHAISCRSAAHSIYDADTLPRNPRLEQALASSLVVQAAANLLPALRSVLGMTPMGWADLLLVGAGSGIPLLVNEWLKRLRRAKMVPTDEAGADLQ